LATFPQAGLIIGETRPGPIAETEGPPGPATGIDLSRWFTCPTLTPLFHTPIYSQLAGPQQLRYNQLTAMCFNELILFFERTFARALERTLKLPQAQCARASIIRFLDDEQRHRRMWHQLNLASAPQWYARSERHILRIAKPLQAMLTLLTSRPEWFPVVIWIMLTLEEHSINMAHRCARMPPEALEPHYAAAHRIHVADEVRHVSVDRELSEKFDRTLPQFLRGINARMFGLFIHRLWLRPVQSAMCVIDALICEFPELASSRVEMRQQLAKLAAHPVYQKMMLSAVSPPGGCDWRREAGETAQTALRFRKGYR
jgi:hypothetical protein